MLTSFNVPLCVNGVETEPLFHLTMPILAAHVKLTAGCGDKTDTFQGKVSSPISFKAVIALMDEIMHEVQDHCEFRRSSTSGNIKDKRSGSSVLYEQLIGKIGHLPELDPFINSTTAIILATQDHQWRTVDDVSFDGDGGITVSYYSRTKYQGCDISVHYGWRDILCKPGPNKGKTWPYGKGYYYYSLYLTQAGILGVNLGSQGQGMCNIHGPIEDVVALLFTSQTAGELHCLPSSQLY